MAEQATPETIRRYLVDNVEAHPGDIASIATFHFGLSRQTINRYLRELVTEGLLAAKGNTKARTYELCVLAEHDITLPVNKDLHEDLAWREHVWPYCKEMAENVVDICNHGVTEIINNVVDHSGSEQMIISVKRTGSRIRMRIIDQGIGIFDKIQKDFGLTDPRHALLELCKGKLTSDETKHTGEGIFFTSRMFDEFSILSGTLYFLRKNKADDWMIESEDRARFDGTSVVMRIAASATHTVKDIFERHASERENLGFTRTHIPIQLALYEGEKLVSRSQARRLLVRFERFKEVFLDFKGVESVGQAFTDEVFRVYAIQNPGTHIAWINATDEVRRMILRTTQGMAPDDRAISERDPNS